MRTVLVWILLANAFALADQVSLATEVNVVGSARMNGGVLRLTTAERNLAGAAWLPDRQPVGGGFETTFQFRLTEQGGLGRGADGLAFVLQNSGPSAIGGIGSGGGFALGNDAPPGSVTAIPRSIAVFFDTYRNEDIGDPSNNFVTVSTAGTPKELHWPPARLALSKKLAVNLKDRKTHTARIEYKPPALTVYLDGARVLATAVDLSTVIGTDGAAWVGFTASTGGGYENHDILSWSFSRSQVSSVMSSVFSDISYLNVPCLPDRNLCTPEHAVVDETGPDAYHVILPGNLERGASIPNPNGRTVTISNAKGSVCHNVSSLGTNGCTGPGALVQRTLEGRTWFSVSLAGDVRDNEGYLEFDIKLE